MSRKKIMIDSTGREISIKLVKPVDKIRDELVTYIGQQAIQLSERVQRFKKDSFADIYSFIDISSNSYNKDIKTGKGNFTLYSYDAQFKIIVSVKERIVFDERLQIAKSLIDNCIKEWVKGSRDEIKLLIDRAFQVDSQGQLNVRRILELRNYNINDEKWKIAMDAIGDSLMVLNSKEYLRVYRRVEDGSYELINLDIAKL